MTDINTPNSAEAENKPRANDNANIALKIAREAMERRLNASRQNDPSGRGQFLREALADDAVIRSTIRQYAASREEYRSVPEVAFQGISSEVLKSELLEISAEFSTKRTSLIAAIHSQFDEANFTGGNIAHGTTLDRMVDDLSLDEMDTLLASPGKRQKFVQDTLSHLVPTQASLDLLWDLNVDPETLTPEQKNAIAKFAIEANITIVPEDVQAVLPLLTTEAQRRKLVQRFLPAIPLTLIRSVLSLTRQEEDDMVRGVVFGDTTGIDLAVQNEQLKSVDRSRIYLGATKVEGNVLDRLFTSRDFARNFAQEMNEHKTEAYGTEITGKNQEEKDKAKAEDDERRYFQTFGTLIQRIKETVTGVEGIDSLNTGSFIVAKHPDGRNIYLRVGTINHGAFARFIENHGRPPLDENGNSIEDPKTIELINIATVGGIKAGYAGGNPNTNESPDTLDYKDFYSLIKGLHGVKVLSADAFTAYRTEHHVAEVPLDNSLTTAAELTKKLDIIDPSGNAHPFKEGMTFTVHADKNGKPTGDSYGVFRVSRVSAGSAQVWIHNGINEEGPVSFSEFHRIMRDLGIHRIKPITTRDDWLNGLANSPNVDMVKAYGSYKFHGDRLLPEHSHSDKDKGIRTFLSPNGELIEVTSFGLNEVEFNVYTGFSQQKVAKNIKNRNQGKKISEVAREKISAGKTGYEILFGLIQKYDCKPADIHHDAIQQHEQEHAHVHKSLWSYIWKGTLCPADIGTALKNVTESFKHRLKFGSDLQASQLAEGIVRRIPWASEWATELRAEMQQKDMKNMKGFQEKLEVLGGKDRRLMIREIVENLDSRPYETYAAILAMLKKTGGLYSDSSLQNLQGTRLYFTALCNIQLRAEMKKNNAWSFNPRPSLAEVQAYADQKWNEIYPEAQSAAANDSGDVRNVNEERMIYMLVKKGDITSFPGGFHAMLQATWMEGKKSETEKGEREAGQYVTAGDRTEYIKTKLYVGERSCAIAAMKKNWDKGWNRKQMNFAPYAMIMGNVPETADSDQLQRFWSEFTLGDHYVYHPLIFMNSPERTEIFRKSLYDIFDPTTEQGKIGRKKLDEIERLRKVSVNAIHQKEDSVTSKEKGEKLYTTIEEFYEEYNDFILDRMNPTKDEYMKHKLAEPDGAKKYPHFVQYLANVDALYSDAAFMTKPNSSETVENAYKHTPPPVKTLVEWIHIDERSGIMQETKETLRVWEALLDQLTNTKNMRIDYEKPADHPTNRAYQRKLYEERMHEVAHKFNGHTAAPVNMLGLSHIKTLISKYGFPPHLFIREEHIAANHEAEIAKGNTSAQEDLKKLRKRQKEEAPARKANEATALDRMVRAQGGGNTIQAIDNKVDDDVHKILYDIKNPQLAANDDHVHAHAA